MTGAQSKVGTRPDLAMITGRAAAVVMLAAVLSGCYTARETTEAIPTDYRQRHPIALSENDRKVVLFIGQKRGELTAAQRADVLAFAQAWKREATGGVIIDVPSGTANQRAAAEALHEIQSIVTAAGIPPQNIRVQRYQPLEPDKLATVKLRYPRIAANAGPCGLWPQDLGPSYDSGDMENRPYWNLGCASQRNLAAMVDNPADLVQPRAETPAYTPRRTTVLDNYSKGKSTATEYPNANAGKISDVGK